jgi:hypothetical protein
MKLTKPLQTPRSRYAPNYPEVMRKLLCGQFPPLDQCQSGSLPPRGFPQIGRESVAGLTLPVAPSYSPAHESPPMDDNVRWMLRRVSLRAGGGFFIE